MYQEWNKKNKNKITTLDDNMECSIYSTEELVVCSENKKEIYTLIDVDPVEERKIDYLKGISKKYTTILLACIILGVITFSILVFQE